MVSSPISAAGRVAPGRPARSGGGRAERMEASPGRGREPGCGATWTGDDYVDVLVWALPALILAALSTTIVG